MYSVAYRQQINTVWHKRGGGNIFFEILWTIEDSCAWTQTSGFKQIPVCMSVSLYMACSTVQTTKPILIELDRCCSLSQYLVYSQQIFWKNLKINPCFGKKTGFTTTQYASHGFDTTVRNMPWILYDSVHNPETYNYSFFV